MHLSLKSRINYGFLLLVCLFIINGVVSIFILLHNKRLSTYIDEVEDPLLEALKDLSKTIDDSKMHSVNTVFLTSFQNDKDSLVKALRFDYKAVESKIKVLSSQLKNQSAVCRLNNVYAEIEKLILFQNAIVATANANKNSLIP